MKTIRALLSLGLILLAAFTHAYYTSYGNAADGFLVKLSRASPEAASVVHDALKKPLVETAWKKMLNDSGEGISYEESRAAVKLATETAVAELMLEDAKSEVERAAAEAELSRLEAIDPYPKSRLKAHKLLKIELGKIDTIDVYYGILPAKNLAGGARFSNEKSFWLGVVLPLALVIVALVTALFPAMLSTLQKPNYADHNGRAPSSIADSGESARRSPSPMRSRPLSDLLKSHFGADFPVGKGSAKRDDPLVITAVRDYVSIEYAVAEFLLSAPGESFSFDGQELRSDDGRHIDELVYATKPDESDDWTTTRRFFFDVSIGFSAIGK